MRGRDPRQLANGGGHAYGVVHEESGDVEACKQILKDCIASACGGEAGEMPAMPESAPTDALSDNAETPAPAPEEDPTALTALSVALKELTGSESPGEIVTWLKGIAQRIDSLDADRAALELSSRRELVGTLVKLGVEFPSTAWEGDPKNRKPVKRLADEPIEELRARVKLLSAARPRTGGEKPTSAETLTITDAHRVGAKKLGITPEEFAQRAAGAVVTA